MANVVFKSTATLLEGLQVDVKSGKHGFRLDEPPSLGGTDTGMNPVEALLASLGGCMAIVGRAFAEHHNIDLQELKIELEGDLDPDGFMGKNPDAKIGFSEIRMNLEVKSESSDEELEEFVKFMKGNCPICDTMINCPEIETNIKRL